MDGFHHRRSIRHRQGRDSAILQRGDLLELWDQVIYLDVGMDIAMASSVVVHDDPDRPVLRS